MFVFFIARLLRGSWKIGLVNDLTTQVVWLELLQLAALSLSTIAMYNEFEQFG